MSPSLNVITTDWPHHHYQSPVRTLASLTITAGNTTIVTTSPLPTLPPIIFPEDKERSYLSHAGEERDKLVRLRPFVPQWLGGASQPATCTHPTQASSGGNTFFSAGFQRHDYYIYCKEMTNYKTVLLLWYIYIYTSNISELVITTFNNRLLI